MSRSRVIAVCAVAGLALGGIGLFLDALGAFNCDTWIESCTFRWIVFWVVLVLPWLVATILFAQSRAISLLSCIVLGLSLSLGFAAWAVISAAANLDHDFAQDDLPEARFFAFFLLIFGTPVIAIATAVVGVVLQSLFARDRTRPEPIDGAPNP
jgi:hypothetical protein